MLRRRVITDPHSGIVIDNAKSVAPQSVVRRRGEDGAAGGLTTSATTLTQRRHSLRYTHNITLPEMHLPSWMPYKHEGSTEKFVNPTPEHPTAATRQSRLHSHMNTWFTDRDIHTSHIFNNPRHIRDYNLFLGLGSQFHVGNKGYLRNGNAISDSELNETRRGQKVHPLSMSLRRPESAGYNANAEDEHVPLGEGVQGYHSRWAFKGRDVTGFANLHWEPYWNRRPLYSSSAVQSAGLRSQSRVDMRDQAVKFEVTVPASSLNQVVTLRSKSDAATKKNDADVTLDLRTDVLEIKSKQHVEEFWDRLKYLIEVHRPAIGDLHGEAFKSRFIRNVHEFFVVFQDAISAPDFQDSYMVKYFEETRPKGMEDLFGIFLEMESNYINEHHCPRCSLPFATTRYCGEGDENTPFREHRGRWAPHKAWSKEWYEVVERRAEQLWYRAVEDPFFGSKDQRHTQKQAEELLKVYCKTKSRGKAISFLVNLRGSLEYLEGTITITPEMQKMHDKLLDTTPHPHLLTNGFKTEAASVKYLLSSSPRLMNSSTGRTLQKGAVIPQSALQFRLDLEMSKFRREQKEEGAVRLPPQGWRINTSPVIEYKADPRTGHITNWRDVKAGIEKSYTDTGLSRDSYTPEEIREIAYLTVQVALSEEKRKALRDDFEAAKRDAGCKFGKGGVGEKAVVFPDRDSYRVFSIVPAAFKAFDEVLTQPPSAAANKATPATAEADIIDVGADSVAKSKKLPTLAYGTQLDVTHYGFENPAEVPVSLPAGSSSANVTLDTTSETCRVFSGYESGQVLDIVPTKAFVDSLNKSLGSAGRMRVGQASKVVIVGVSKEGFAGSSRAELLAQELPTLPTDTSKITSKTAVEGGIVFSLGSCIEEIQPGAAKPLNSDVVANFTSIVEAAPYTILPPALTLIQKERQPAGRATVIGVRQGQLWVQWDTANPQQASVAVSLGCPLSLSKMWNIAIAPASAVSSPVEPFSWNTPFRNDWASERLEELKKAPWNRQRFVSLIENKMTPKVKRFGYTQHITQDDFVTKEYQDRLTSRQFFNSPQSFEIIPDASAKGVRFSHKDEGSLKFSGLPGADRHEVENGWGRQEVINDDEVSDIEQALRDISGRRPGNYIKSEEEKSSLELNESWWGAFRPGWKNRNAQKMLLHPSDRQTEDGSKYAFRGNLPPVGTTFGMADRIREIVDDYSRGFGLGPSGHGPYADQGHFNTLGQVATQTATLGYINPLVRLFDEKLSKINGSGVSVEQLVFDWCNSQQQNQQRGKGVASERTSSSPADRAFPNPRNLLLDIKEWRESGRPPTLHLTRLLQDIIKNEVAEFNAGVPEGVPKLSLLDEFSSEAAGAASSSSTASLSLYSDPLAGVIGSSNNNNDIWADVDRFAVRYELHNRQEGAAMGLGGNRSSSNADDGVTAAMNPVGAPGGTELTGYILHCVVAANLRNSIASVQNSIIAEDESLAPACQQTVIARFLTEVSSRIGRKIDTLFLQTHQSTKDTGGRSDRQGKRLEHSPKQLIHMDELKDILLRFNVSTQVTDSCIRGLRSLTSTVKETIPVSELLAWGGPGSATSRTSTTANNTKLGDLSKANAPVEVHSFAKSVGVQGGNYGSGMLDLMGKGATATGRKPAARINPALWSLLRVHDGKALDIIFAARRNKANDLLLGEFLSCIRGVTLRGPVVDEIRMLAGDDQDAFYRGLFERYTDGTYSPSLEEAVAMFTNFLTTVLQPGAESVMRKHYFKYPPTQSGANIDESNRLPLLVKPLPTASGIHFFDSVKSSVTRIHAELEAAGIPDPAVYREYPFVATNDSLIKSATAATTAQQTGGASSAATVDILQGKTLTKILSEAVQKLGAADAANAKYWTRLANFQEGALARRLFFGLFARSMPLLFEYADLAQYVLDDGKASADSDLAAILPLLPTHSARSSTDSFPSAQLSATNSSHPRTSTNRAAGVEAFTKGGSNGTGEAAIIAQTPSYNRLRHVYNIGSTSPINAGARLASATAKTFLDTTYSTTGRPNNASIDADGFGATAPSAAYSSQDNVGAANGAAAYDEQLTVSRTLHSTTANDSNATIKDMKELGVVLTNDANAQIELDFKRNAERYWKKIIDGSSAGMLEELSRTSSASGGGRGGGGNRTFTGGGSSRGGDSNRGFVSSTTVGRDSPYNNRAGRGTSSYGSGRGVGRGGGGGSATPGATPSDRGAYQRGGGGSYGQGALSGGSARSGGSVRGGGSSLGSLATSNKK